MHNRSFLLSQVRHALLGYSNLLLALSGGIDSIVLLHLLTELRRERPEMALRAVYIHHGLSANAADWREHCRSVCAAWQVTFASVEVCVDSRDSGVEAGARQARYRALEGHLLPGEALLTAQHLDDQCETFLLALKRGSGPAGLSAMAADWPFGQTRQIRPLLNVSRAQIEEYAHERQLSWVNDESNADDRYDRNFLRLRVLPILQQRWPDFARATARSASLCAEQELLIDELLAAELSIAVGNDGGLLISALRRASEVKRNALMRRWFEQRESSMPSRGQLYTLWQEVALARDDAEPQLTLGDKTVRRFKGRLYLLDQMQDLRSVELDWDGKTPLPLPDGLGQLIAADTEAEASAEYTLRMPQDGERIYVRFAAQGNVYVQGKPHSRPIKKLWQALNVPPWQRARVPLIYYNNELIAAVGLFVTREGATVNGERGWSVSIA